MKNGITPAEIGRRICSRRQQMNLSMRECSRRAGIATSFFSKVESGRASPTMMTLQKILESLDTDLATFFNDQSRDPARKIVFPHQKMKLIKDGDRKWFFAFPRRCDIKMTLTYEEYRPRTRVVEYEHHATDLCGLVIDGELTLEIPGEGVRRLRKNDAFYLPSRQKHLARNDGAKPLKMVVVQLRA